MADSLITALSTLDESTIADADLFVVEDVSASSTKAITFADLLSRSLPNGAYALDLDSVSWTRRYRFDSVSGSDGDAISSCADLGGSSDPMVQGTAGNRPTLKTGGNGINGHNVARFTTDDYLASTSGGASLTGDWYAWCVVKWSSLTGHQSFLSWGDGSGNGERRSLHKYTGTNHLYFIGESADVASTQALSTGTVYLIEARYLSSSGVITFWVNGEQVGGGTPSAALAAYADTDLILGRNTGTSEYFEGDMAEAAWYGGALPSGLPSSVRTYCESRYGVTLADSVQATYSLESDLAIGSLDHIMTGGTNQAFDNEPLVSVGGCFAAHALSQTHLLSNDWTGQNSLMIWNQHSTGFSAIAFCLPGTAGAEHGALGIALNQSPWGGTDGSFYIETSNFTDPSKYGDLRFVQTKFTGGLHRLRSRLRDDTQDWEWYAGDGSTVVYTITTGGVLSVGTYLAESVAAAVSAAGTDQSGATLLAAQINQVTSATGGVADGVRMPTAVAGRTICVANESGATVKVYPASGASIDDGAGDAAYSLADNAHKQFKAISTTKWLSF